MKEKGEAERRVDAADLTRVVTAIFQRVGMLEEDADLLATTLIAADLRGVHSHGVMRVPNYVHRLTKGGVDPRGRPRIVRDMGAALLVDGGNSMGQIGGRFAMERIIERARTTGIAAAGVRGSNHCGAMAYFAMMALEEDMIGLATTNALPVMAPWGGAERILGINPLAVAIPTGEEFPIVLDMAFSGSARGKIQIYHQKGLRLPEGWALDAEGRPTTDPAAALDGLLMPIGGFKGTGLALVMGLLSAVLTGASYGTELGSLETGSRPGEDGHFFMAIRVAAFEDVDRFKARVDGVIRQIHACRLAEGFNRTYAPGELEFLTEAAYRRDGIPLNAVTLADLMEEGKRLGVDVTALASS
ncbi:MAG: Ldh family oxidoreductase [candidate division NC10 bacterium]|nr:Ldh family oxidoreductase [candidate division NC10 bacterium]